MNMRIKLTLPTSQPPLRANPTDAGADLFSPVVRGIQPHNSVFIDLGVQVEIPEGYTGLIFARSGLGGRGIRPRNCVGVIDSKYRGNLGIQLENVTDEFYIVQIGDRIAQLVIVPVETPTFTVTDKLDITDDRGGGFGSSGK